MSGLTSASPKMSNSPPWPTPALPLGKSCPTRPATGARSGNFGNAILVKYGPNACADAGLNGEYYLPGVGLVHRAYLTIAGPSSFDLIYARIGGRTYLSEPHISFSLALDRSLYELRPDQPGEDSKCDDGPADRS